MSGGELGESALWALPPNLAVAWAAWDSSNLTVAYFCAAMGAIVTDVAVGGGEVRHAFRKFGKAGSIEQTGQKLENSYNESLHPALLQFKLLLRALKDVFWLQDREASFAKLWNPMKREILDRVKAANVTNDDINIIGYSGAGLGYAVDGAWRYNQDDEASTQMGFSLVDAAFGAAYLFSRLNEGKIRTTFLSRAFFNLADKGRDFYPIANSVSVIGHTIASAIRACEDPSRANVTIVVFGACELISATKWLIHARRTQAQRQDQKAEKEVIAEAGSSVEAAERSSQALASEHEGKNVLLIFSAQPSRELIPAGRAASGQGTRAVSEGMRAG